jgi:hypothetical protein
LEGFTGLAKTGEMDEKFAIVLVGTIKDGRIIGRKK